MKSLHCLWAKSNNRTHGQIECDMNWFCFCFDFVLSHIRYHLEKGGEGVHMKLDVHGQEIGKNVDLDGQGVGGLENWTIFMDVICVSFLKRFV